MMQAARPFLFSLSSKWVSIEGRVTIFLNHLSLGNALSGEERCATGFVPVFRERLPKQFGLYGRSERLQFSVLLGGSITSGFTERFAVPARSRFADVDLDA